MENDFEVMDHTADVGIVARGDDMRAAFANAARGLFSLITELDSIDEIVHRDITLTSTDLESLLVAWLNELIYLFDTKNIVFKRFEISVLNDKRLEARSYGETFNSLKHPLKTGVKAATYHMLQIDRNDINRVQVLFDI